MSRSLKGPEVCTVHTKYRKYLIEILEIWKSRRKKYCGAGLADDGRGVVWSVELTGGGDSRQLPEDRRVHCRALLLNCTAYNYKYRYKYQ